MNPLTGMALAYLIGASGPIEGKEGIVTEVPYDSGPAKRGISIGYCNLLDEENKGRFPPYRKQTDTAEQYNEGVPDANGPGFEENLKEQFQRRKLEGFTYIELDNPDAYTLADVLRATDLARIYGLRVIAKNPALISGGAQWLKHPNVYGAIVEKDAGSPSGMATMRPSSDFPIWFVSFGSGRAWASLVAADIAARGYPNMSVTYSAGGEYTRSQDILLPQKTQSQSMPAVPAHLALARTLVGTDEYSGGNDNAKILGFAKEIGRRYPEMAAYCAQYNHDSIPWCGLFAGYCMAMSGIRPVFGPTDTDKFLWAQAWKQFGTEVDTPQIGDVLVFARHVTFYNGEDGGYYLCLGGNQSDSVTVARYSKSSCEAILRPPGAGATVAPSRSTVSNFDKCLPLLLEHEGGNDDDPRDPGGRTSRGILQSEWYAWRGEHLNIDLPSDVWDAPQDQVAAIYREKYWDALWCDQLPSGVDYAIFDYGVNSGIGRAARVLQSFIDTDVDGEVGPLTVAAAAHEDAGTLIGQICDERLAFLQGLSTWPTFGNGWGRRVREVRAAALEMATKGTPMPKAPDVTILPPTSQIDLKPLLEALLAVLSAVQQTKAPIALPPPVVEPTPPAPGTQQLGTKVGAIVSVGIALAQVFGFLPPAIGPEATQFGTGILASAIGGTAIAPTGIWGLLGRGLKFLVNKIPT